MSGTGLVSAQYKPWRAYLVLFGVAALVVSRWFRSGTFIATGDMGPWIRRGWAPEALWSWNHSVTGAGSAAYNVARSAEFVVIWVVQHLGGDEYAAQWAFYTLIYGLVAVGVGFLAGAFVRSEIAIVAAGTFAVLNGFFLTRLPNPLNIISVGSIALITAVAVRVGQGRRISPVVGALCLVPTSFLGFNPPMIVVAYAWALAGTPLLVALVLGRSALWRLLKWFVFVAPWAILINAWWLVPFVQGFTGGGGATANATFTDPTNWSWAQANNSVPNVLTMVANWAWFRPQYLPFAASLDQPAWVWLRYLLPALVFVAPVVALKARRRLALVLVGLTLVVVFLAKGLVPPLTAVNYWMYLHVPGFWLFREPMSKLGQLLVLFFGVLIALVVEAVVVRLREAGGLRRLPMLSRVLQVGLLAAVVGVLAYPFPLFTGGVMPDVRPSQPSAHVRVPTYWWQMAETIDADPRPGKVLVLPQDDYYQMPTTWGFFGVDSVANLLIQHPVVQRKPDGYFGDVAGFSADVAGVETALLTGDLSAVPPLLDALGVSKVIVRHDLIRGMVGRRFADDKVLAEAVARVPGLSRAVDGPLELWSVGSGTSPTVKTYAATLDAPASADGVAAAIASTGTDRAMVARASSTPPTTTPVVDHGPQVAGDVITWPVPAVTKGPARTTVTVARAGSFTMSQRARAAAVLVAGWQPATHSVTLTDPTRALVDGHPVSSRASSSVTVPAGTTPVAVRAGARTVSLDGWGSRDTGPRTVPVGAATPVTVFAPSRRPARSTAYSEVYDCNNYEPRPAAELGLKSAVVSSGGHEVLRLTALDHAACSRVTVLDAKPGRTYRVRVQYRALEGKRPQVCLWQTNTDGCELAARPSIGGEWTSYERFVTIDKVASGLQVVLHADVGERFVGRSVTEYRDLQIEAVDPVATATVWPHEIAPHTVRLSAGTHTLEVTGGPSGSVLAPFEPLQDCFRKDDQTPEQADLLAKDTTPKGGAPAFTLGARDHMACVGATAPGYGASSLYELSYAARSVALRNPKVCLYLRGPDRCATLPTGGPWDTWTSYGTLVTPDPSAVETRVYLYGLRDLAGKKRSQVDYRDVLLRPVASPNTLVLVRDPEAVAAPAVTWTRQDPAHFAVDVAAPASAGAVVALTETAAPGWQLPRAAGQRIVVQGWMNAWPLDGAVKGTIAYGPARISRLALYTLPPMLLLAVFYVLVTRWWHRRRQPVREARAARRLAAKAARREARRDHRRGPRRGFRRGPRHGPAAEVTP